AERQRGDQTHDSLAVDADHVVGAGIGDDEAAVTGERHRERVAVGRRLRVARITGLVLVGIVVALESGDVRELRRERRGRTLLVDRAQVGERGARLVALVRIGAEAYERIDRAVVRHGDLGWPGRSVGRVGRCDGRKADDAVEQVAVAELEDADSTGLAVTRFLVLVTRRNAVAVVGIGGAADTGLRDVQLRTVRAGRPERQLLGVVEP